MRVAIITESFPPDVNGVAQLRRAGRRAPAQPRPRAAGHRPGAGVGARRPPPARCRTRSSGCRRCRCPATPASGSACPSRRIAAALTAHRTDLVHLASPFFLGGPGAGRRAGWTCPPSPCTRPTSRRTPACTGSAGARRTAWRWLRRIHNSADRTLAPSTAAATALLATASSGCGSGGAASTPPASTRPTAARRCAGRSRRTARSLVGYVGRLAVEKRVDLLAPVARHAAACGWSWSATVRPRAALRRARCPARCSWASGAAPNSARIYASLDVFAHTGPFETFGQTVQEALASGLPVVAPAAGGPLDLVTPGPHRLPGAAGGRRRRWPRPWRCWSADPRAAGRVRARGPRRRSPAAPGPRPATS